MISEGPLWILIRVLPVLDMIPITLGSAPDTKAIAIFILVIALKRSTFRL